MKLNEVYPDKDQIDAVRRAMRTYTRIEPYLNPCSHGHGIAMVIGAIRLGWRTHDRIVNGICSMGSDVYREEVEQTLHTFTGNDPEQHCWFRDAAGTYHLLH